MIYNFQWINLVFLNKLDPHQPMPSEPQIIFQKATLVSRAQRGSLWYILHQNKLFAQHHPNYLLKLFAITVFFYAKVSSLFTRSSWCLLC
jgi:hypothetical protein